MTMQTVGIKQLKARLSEYLRAVRAGETLLVTDRDEVVAELRPARRRLGPGERLSDRLDALAGAGALTRARRRKAGWTWKAAGLGLPAGTSDALLDEIRGERASG